MVISEEMPDRCDFSDRAIDASDGITTHALCACDAGSAFWNSRMVNRSAILIRVVWSGEALSTPSWSNVAEH